MTENSRELVTTADVMSVLGGPASVAQLTGRKYSAAHNWGTFVKFPANTYVVMQAALAEKGYAAPASLWGMVERDRHAERQSESRAS